MPLYFHSYRDHVRNERAHAVKSYIKYLRVIDRRSSNAIDCNVKKTSATVTRSCHPFGRKISL